MRIFVTGASGWIGSATTAELLKAGHQVVGLARSDESAAKLEAAGAEVRRGDLDDLDGLRSAATEADGVIHLGYKHDFSPAGIAEGARADTAAITTLGDALVGTGKPFVIASGVVGLAPGRTATEQDQPNPAAHPRSANAAATLAYADRGVRSAVVRFAPTVHGRGDYGFMAFLVDIARRNGVSGYPGDGSNRWPAVHVSDAAALVRLVVEQAPAGTSWHAIAEEGVTSREIAEAIGRALDLPVKSVPVEHFEWLAMFFAMDAPVSSEYTQHTLGWKPTGPGLVADLDAGAYTG
ncbi:nucleoside-diphosphate-sugar epimerase [Actinoplanes tereljensis]|uniref:Oxidoreductase n=1 Tax=Paractinoplanes tereljensis TaxID=571912 RepID=A0A919NHQ8_9ACTN|nr:SDR family oxidoreductase [Actinoplanes tereljensis]GIF18683.1 oxidoreductase [Actinoplanes tereljensis]